MRKNETVVPRYTPPEAELKEGSKAIRSAYFKNWYESCKDIYNKERRKKRKEKKRIGKNHAERDTVKGF
jgi:hypothetical protein